MRNGKPLFCAKRAPVNTRLMRFLGVFEQIAQHRWRALLKTRRAEPESRDVRSIPAWVLGGG